MIDIFLKQVIKIAESLVKAKIDASKGSPALAYFRMYQELIALEHTSSGFFHTLQSLVDEDREKHDIGEQLHGLRESGVYRDLRELADSVSRLYQLLSRDLEDAMRIHDQELWNQLMLVVEVKYRRLQFWEGFFRMEGIVDSKEIYDLRQREGKPVRIAGDSYFDDQSHSLYPFVSWRDHGDRDPYSNRKLVRGALESAYGVDAQLVSIRDYDALERLLDSAWDTMEMLRVTLDSMAEFIQKNFTIEQLFQGGRWQFWNPKHKHD